VQFRVNTGTERIEFWLDWLEFRLEFRLDWKIALAKAVIEGAL
jgi:hypothetical protein